MLLYTLIQLFSLILIFSLFGAKVLLYYGIAALMGILLLETINYIEHYGLQRDKVSEYRYELVQPWHSWNSNHVLGRIILFELTRHSDHHYDASKKYQLLDNHEYAPTLPLGYPGSMLLSLIPPLWYFLVHKKIESIEKPG